MPKSKPTQVITHRIELNDTERKMLKEMKDAKVAESIGKAAAYASVPAGIAGLFYLGVKIGEASLPVGQKMSEELKDAWDKFFLNPKFWSADIGDSRLIDAFLGLFKNP